MKGRDMLPYCIAPVVLLAVVCTAPMGWWTYSGVFMAGMLTERAIRVWVVTWRAERRFREAEECRHAQLAECNCGSIDGHPHEPDCIWWDRRDLKEQRIREAAGK